MDAEREILSEAGRERLAMDESPVDLSHGEFEMHLDRLPKIIAD